MTKLEILGSSWESNLYLNNGPCSTYYTYSANDGGPHHTQSIIKNVRYLGANVVIELYFHILGA